MLESKQASPMANVEKKKKGLNKFIHKGGNRNQPKVESDSSVLSNKKSISLAWLSKKPKAIPEIEKEKGEEKRIEVEGPVVVEARKSVSHVETNVASVASFLQVKVLVSDMPSFMQVQAFRCARRTYDSLEKFSTKHMAFNIKKEFDKVHGPTWHCIVGSSFGSFVTHSTGCFLYFSMEKLYILLFKTKVQKKVRD